MWKGKLCWWFLGDAYRKMTLQCYWHFWVFLGWTYQTYLIYLLADPNIRFLIPILQLFSLSHVCSLHLWSFWCCFPLGIPFLSLSTLPNPTCLSLHVLSARFTYVRKFSLGIQSSLWTCKSNFNLSITQSNKYLLNCFYILISIGVWKNIKRGKDIQRLK